MNISNTNLENLYGFESPFQEDPLSIRALHYLKNAKHVLDVGCGEGADTVFYAKEGFQVTAIDNNEVYLNRLRAFRGNNELTNISVILGDVLQYKYRENHYDVVSCLLVGCCMKRSDFEKLLDVLKRTVKHNGIIIMSLRNYLDPEFQEYENSEGMIEPNTFRKRDDCCKIRYYIEKNRLQKLISDFEILYYFEGLTRDKYEEVEKHGDSYIICRKKGDY